MRKLFCAPLVFALCLGIVVAEEKKQEKKGQKKPDVKKKAEASKSEEDAKGSQVSGTFKRYDPNTGSLTIAVKEKDKATKKDKRTDKEFTVPGSAKLEVKASDNGKVQVFE